MPQGRELTEADRWATGYATATTLAPVMKSTSASRCHHLLKTFWTAWNDEQRPDGTVTRPGHPLKPSVSATKAAQKARLKQRRPAGLSAVERVSLLSGGS